jgi:threonine dehydratase
VESSEIQPSSVRATSRTPLVRLRRVVADGAAEVLVKVEGGNLTGSYKDRMAWPSSRARSDVVHCGQGNTSWSSPEAARGLPWPSSVP